MCIAIYDAHNHLQTPALFPHREKIFADFANPPFYPVGAAPQKAPVLRIAGGVINGTCPDDWNEVKSLSRKHPEWIPSFGVHPWLVDDLPDDWLAHLRRVVSEHLPRTAIGEIGLDRWKTKQNLPLQRQVFSLQWQLAAELELPITVHCLHAWGELMEFLRHAPPAPRGFLLHAYGGPVELVPALIRYGAFFSFNGSFLDRQKKCETFRKIPMDRLLIESDAPSMGLSAPGSYELPCAPDGSRIHHPAEIVPALADLARLLDIPLAQLAQCTSANFLRLFC